MCADMKQAKSEFMIRFDMCIDILRDGLEFDEEDFELAIRFTRDFYEKNKPFIATLVKQFNKPVLIELWEDRFFYYVLKWEFNFVDNLGKASALSTDQLDIENAERYDIAYVDENGRKKRPLILHCSPSGAIERCIYAMLEKAYRDQKKGKPPMLPLWLAPTQVRIIPISDNFIGEAQRLADKIETNRIRTDIDDRSMTLQKKVREAETEWINYVLVIGQREVDSGVLPVRDRKAGRIRKMRIQQLTEEIRKKTEGKPFQPLTLPRLLSKRPQF